MATEQLEQIEDMSRDSNAKPHISEISKCVSYNPITGSLVWLAREDNSKGWNTKYAGRESGRVNNKGYRQLSFMGHKFQAHRVIFYMMTGELPDYIDHADHDRTNNKWDNLSETDAAGNAHNVIVRDFSPYGIHGVSNYGTQGYYRARIKFNNVETSLYNGNDFFEACCARKSAENRLGFHVNHGMKL